MPSALSLQSSAVFSSPLIIGILHTSTCLKTLSEETCSERTKGINLLEVRLDAFPQGFLMPIKWPLPVIATARDPKKGGLNHLSLEQRQGLLESALPWASFIDIELQNAKKLSATIACAREAQRSIIFSHHNFEKTPSLAELQNLVTNAHDLGADIVKVATMTSSEKELDRLLEFQQLPHPLPVTAMGMGPLGKKSRLQLAKLGAKLLYGYLYKPLSFAPASTQWSAQELATFVHMNGSVKSEEYSISSS